MTETAQVLAFPRECSNCQYVAFAGSDLFCLQWTQFVAEPDARDCEAFLPSGER